MIKPNIKHLYRFDLQVKNPLDFVDGKPVNPLLRKDSLWVLVDVPEVGLSWAKSDNGKDFTFYLINTKEEEARGILYRCICIPTTGENRDQVLVRLIQHPDSDFIVFEQDGEDHQYFNMKLEEPLRFNLSLN